MLIVSNSVTYLHFRGRHFLRKAWMVSQRSAFGSWPSAAVVRAPQVSALTSSRRLEKAFIQTTRKTSRRTRRRHSIVNGAEGTEQTRPYFIKKATLNQEQSNSTSTMFSNGESVNPLF